eukprot:8831596-Alexandrium_andersonii.AAC.1
MPAAVAGMVDSVSVPRSYHARLARASAAVSHRALNGLGSMCDVRPWLVGSFRKTQCAHRLGAGDMFLAG